MSHFIKPVVVSLDMSRFDQHVHVRQLQVEHSVYLRSNPDPYFARLLSWQLKNEVKSNIGFKYTAEGRRMSGDMNTALGNCIIVLSMVVGMFENILRIPYDVFDDGDDCLVIVEEEDMTSFMTVTPWYMLQCGHEVKVENIAKTLEDVEWCQSKPIFTGVNWKFVRNPFKTMSGALVGTRWLVNNHRMRREFLAGVAQCELVLNSGVPILEEFAKALLRNAGDAVPRFDQTSGEWWRYVREMKNTGPLGVTDDARASFARAFNVSIDQQHDIELQLSKWELDLTHESEASTWNPETWINDQEGAAQFPEGNYT